MNRYSYKTRHGTAVIQKQPDGRWMLLFEGEGLGIYQNPSVAAEEFANGYCTWPSAGDPTPWGVPEELDGWSSG